MHTSFVGDMGWSETKGRADRPGYFVFVTLLSKETRELEFSFQYYHINVSTMRNSFDASWKVTVFVRPTRDIRTKLVAH